MSKFKISIIALYNIIYAIILLNSIISTQNLFVPSLVPLIEYHSIQYTFLYYFTLLAGTLILFSGISLLLWKNWTSIAVTMSLVLGICCHIIQVIILISFLQMEEHIHEYWLMVAGAYIQGLQLDPLLQHLSVIDKFSKGYLWYFIVTAFFLLADIVVVYILTINSKMQENNESPLQYRLQQIVDHRTGFSEHKGITRLKILVYMLTLTGITTMILGISYGLVFPGGNLFLILFTTTFLAFSFFSLALFLFDKRVKVIPLAIFFFSILLLYTLFRVWFLPETYFKEEMLMSIIKNKLWGILFFILIDLLTLLFCIFIVGFGLFTLLGNGNVIKLFFQNSNKKEDYSLLF